MSSGKGHNRDANAAARVARALDLRKAGATYDAIARQCGYGSRAAAYNALTEAEHAHATPDEVHA